MKNYFTIFNQLTSLGKRLAVNTLSCVLSYKRYYLLLTTFLVVGVGTAWGATWEKATSIAADDVVLLVCESKSMELSSISTTTSTKYGVGVAYTTTPAGAYELIVEEGNTSGTFSFKNNSSYLYWSSGNSLATNATKNANTLWTITFDNGNATIKNSNDATRVIGWNASSPRFACYTSSQTAVQLYKKVDVASDLVDPTATFLDGEYTVGGTLDLSTLWSSNSTGAVTYSIITDGGTGATINGTSFTATTAGTCTVQASQTATTSYNAVTITATITITAAYSGGGENDDCDKWVEVYLSEIEKTDIVVVTMTSSSGTYAMSNNNETGSAPAATAVTVSGTTLTGDIADNIKWNISNSNGSLTFYPNGTNSTWLYCTSTNNGVRVGTNTSRTFTIDATSGYLKHTGTSRYIGIYNSQDWRCYTSVNDNIKDQTLKFYKYVGCTTETSQLVTPTNLQVTNITSSGATLSWTAVANADGYRVTINGKKIDTDSTTYTATELTANTSYTWTVTALSDSTDYSDSETASHTFTTLAAASDPYTVTFDAGSGTCTTTSLTEASGGAGVTLPTASPSDACTEEGWTFAGWAEASVATQTTTAPATLLAAGDTYNPTADCPLYAVYSITETGGGSGTVCFDFADIATEQNWESESNGHNDITISPINIYVDKGTSDYNGRWWSDNTWRIYKNNTITITSTEGEITNVTSNLSVSFSINDGEATLTATDTYKFTQITVTYSGGGSTTYNSNPSCVPTYSITYNFAGGTGSHCSNTSVQQGNPYTICNEAPTKEGNTFLHWSDGVNTYNPSDVIATVTTDITLTAVWQPNTYTVTWSNNGVETGVPYNHGVALVVPEAPESCDGVKEFVGWTALQSDYYHATDAPSDLFTTASGTVTADATYYAVFATPPSSGSGGGTPTTVEDVLTRATTGVTGTTYTEWTGKTDTSKAVYAGQSAGGNDAIQLRSNNSNSGIVTTTSGGKLARVEVEWNESTTSGRTLDIYGRNVAYKNATELYSSSTQGTKLGSIVYGTSTELTIEGDYEYIGLRSNSSAMYLASVIITWSSASGSSASYSDYTTICQEVTGIAISGSYPTTFMQYDAFSFEGGTVTATLEDGSTADVTSQATFSGYNLDNTGTQTVTVTYMGFSVKYEITVTESDRWRLTWNVNGKTNTGASPIYVQKGSAIGTLPTPVVPDACEGKTFMGWTTSNIVNSDGTGITYITEETVPTDNTTYYAVFATVNNFSTQAAIEDIESGSKVVIVAVASLTDDGGTGKAISSRTISITSQGVIGLSGDEVSIFDETINTPHSTCIWTLTKETGGVVFEQGGKYIRAVNSGYRKLLLENTKDYWTLTLVEGKDKTYHMQSGNTSHYVEWFDHTDSKYDEGERYIGFVPYTEANDNGDFDMQFFVTANADGEADITDYTTGCEEYTITYYGFTGGYSTSCSSDGTIILPVNSIHTVPNCGDVVKDHTNLNREFTGKWMTQPHGGHTFLPGETFVLTQDTTLYAQWTLEATGDITLPTDIEDLAGTDVLVYGGKTLTIQPGTTTINSLTLKGGLQTDGSYSMPNIWVPAGATLIRNSNKINLDLAVNANNYYPFAVPFAAKNNANVEYLDPTLAAASTYGTHFAIKTYDGARRAEVGEDKANNWVRVLRDSTLQPGVGYIITAMTYPDKDTATIRIPMTVPNTWFDNGEQAIVGTTDRTAMAVTAHTGTAATEHQRHAGWNFVANPYLTNFAGGNVVSENGLDYINGELVIQGSYEYLGEDVPYVTVPAHNFAYYTAHKLSDIKLSPEYSFFVQVGTSGTMNFTTAGRQQAPAGIAARNAEEQPIKMDVDITLSDNHNSDHTGIIICDRYSNAYEVGRDLEKMFGSAYNLTVYTLMEDNTPLAFQALAIRSSMQVIPVGYRAPEQGEYTFRLNEATSSIDLLNEQYEQLILVDYQTGELTNLLYTNYTFYSERTQSNSRFAIYAVPRQNAPTDLPNAIGNKQEVRKVIYNDHLYILRDGNVYNGMGQKM